MWIKGVHVHLQVRGAFGVHHASCVGHVSFIGAFEFTCECSGTGNGELSWHELGSHLMSNVQQVFPSRFQNSLEVLPGHPTSKYRLTYTTPSTNP
jgi:hypothetical protein